jgi:hypothetical protein
VAPIGTSITQLLLEFVCFCVVVGVAAAAAAARRCNMRVLCQLQ